MRLTIAARAPLGAGLVGGGMVGGGMVGAPLNWALPKLKTPFPPEAGSLLPGLLAATRTGPSPAGDDELVVEIAISIYPSPSNSLGALPFAVELRGGDLVISERLRA
jgi:hypothetical protein